jgi:chromosome segregation ATPase
MELERLKDVQDDLFKAFLENVTDAQLFQFGFKSGDWDRFSYAVEFAEKKTQHLNEGIEEQQKVVDGIADSIVDYTKKSAILTEELSLSEIMSKNYGNTISGLNQKLSELTNVYENAEKGSSDYKTATKEIKKVSKELAKEYDKLAVKTGAAETIVSRVQCKN